MEGEKKNSGFGTASLVLGIISISTSFIVIINNMSFILGIIGVILGIVSLIKKSSKGKSIWGIVLCILAIIITINFQQNLSNSLNDISDNLSGKNTETILENNVDVTIGDFNATKSYGIYETSLPITVKNKSSEKKSFNIHIEAVSSDGERIEEDYVYANDLNAGQSQKFNIFTFVSSDKVSEMKKATFKIIDISMY